MEKMIADNQTKYLNRFNRIYPWIAGFSEDLLFFSVIDTLFFTYVKNFTADQIVFIATISSVVSIILRFFLLKIIQKIGNTKSFRLALFLLLLASIIITFGNSYAWIVFGSILYEISFVFRSMESIILKNNLLYQNKSEDFIHLKNKSNTIYAVVTAIIAMVAGYLYGLNSYLPMYFCIFFSLLCLLFSFFIKDVTSNDIIHQEASTTNTKIKLSNISWLILLIYGVFYSIINLAQTNDKLLIQYELSNHFNITDVAMYIGIIVTISRIFRVIANFSFGQVYKKYKSKVNIILTALLAMSFFFIVLGYFMQGAQFIRFTLMSLGFCLILGVRDPFRLYIYDLILKITNPVQHQVILYYLEFARKVATMLLSFIASAALIHFNMIYVIASIGFLAIIELILTLKLYILARQY